ncbi:hypothetical protein H2198_001553 [Neophaeococcomyces mojaviensis]|uniref:Uncharacterized protein n=1 Tax=Neophaeococcomyces mojaviensis TaxID=3383035 RepID=A0ACC3AGW9_9EURO|nr:hypothetical protein H2198_001553 [Knufia sp. JES_112]
MLPGALFTTYKQYKHDTKVIVEWLADTARKCGYDPSTASQNTEAKKPKLKSSARKLARDSAAAAAKDNVASSTRIHVVKVRDFVPMAQCIADSKDTKIIIPLKILKIFKSCITARSTTHKWYETEPLEEEEKEGNITHEFFINSLKRSLQVLVPVAKLRELDQNHCALPNPSAQAYLNEKGGDNRYAHLEIQDIDEEAYEAMANAVSVTSSAAPNVNPQPTTPQAKVKYIAEDLDEFSEFHFALSCFMDDVTTLQYQLKSFWEQYANSEVDLTTVAVTTNTAIEMVKKAEQEFSKIKKPSLNGVYDRMRIPDIWFMECCIRDGVSPEDFSDTSSRKFFVPLMAWEQVKESYLLLFRLAIIYSNGTTPGLRGRDRIFAITRPAYLGTYNPELEFDDLSPEKQYEQIAAIVSDMFATVGGYCVLGEETPNDDMLMRGISYLQQHQVDPPMWLLFACQNFLDIHFVLKTRSERPYEELRDFALSACRTVKTHQRFLRDHPMPNMRPNNVEDEAAVDGTMREIEEWTLEDKMKQILNSAPMFGKTKKRRVWQDFEVLRMSPVLCGLWKYCFHIQLQWKGITLVNDTGIVAAAHIYNALLQNDYLGSAEKRIFWQDMEYLLDLHQAEDTFLGDKRPKTIEDCTKRLALVQGVAPQTFARRRRGNNHRVLRSRAGSKFLTPSTLVAKIFGQKYLTDTNTDWHLDQLDAIVGRKFEKDKSEMVAFNKKMNTLVKELDLNTQEARTELLISCAAKNNAAMAKSLSEETVNGLKIIIALAQYAINSAAFDCHWVGPVQQVLDEERQKLKEKENQRVEDKEIENPKDETAAVETSQSEHADAPSISPASAELQKHIDEGGINPKPLADPKKHLDLIVHKMQSVSKAPSNDGQESDIESFSSEDNDLFEGSTMSANKSLVEIMERWEQTKTLPIEIFIDILYDCLQAEYLDIQFDYFAFFRLVLSLMLEIQEAVVPILRPRLLDREGRASMIIDKPEGAVCVVPQLSLLVACDPLNAPNLLVLKPWLEVDLRPLQLAASIMKPWLKEHGDEYCLSEEEREDRRKKNVTKEGLRVKYIDDDSDDGAETSTTNDKSKERKIGWSSSVGIMEGLDAREMRQIFDHMKIEGHGGMTVAQTMAKLKGLELDEDDKELIQMQEEALRALEESKQSRRKKRESKPLQKEDGRHDPETDEEESE